MARRVLLGAGISSIKSLDCRPWSFRGLESSRREIKIKKPGFIWEKGKSQCLEVADFFCPTENINGYKLKDVLHNQTTDSMHSYWGQQNVLIANDKSKMVVNCRKIWARLPERSDSWQSMKTNSWLLSPPSAPGYLACWFGYAWLWFLNTFCFIMQ